MSGKGRKRERVIGRKKERDTEETPKAKKGEQKAKGPRDDGSVASPHHPS